jgi:DNA-binding Lrp family transcriptional regulator
MESQLSDIERKILGVLQGGMPRTLTPYKDMACEIGISTDELLETLRGWQENGKLRRIGAVVSHVKVGIGSGSMVVWKVDPEKIEEIGTKLASFEAVTHAYERPMSDTWPYNMYTMVHGIDDEDVTRTVEEMSRACGVKNYHQLQTERELKKVPPTYIIDR